MGRYIVCVFDGDRSVYDAARAVQQLDDEGSIAVYEAAIISKDAGGEVRIEDAAEDMPFGTGTGMLLGGLLGLLMDADVAGVDDDFLDTITRKLEPGNFALIAEISEGWTVPLDTRIEELGGTIHRGWRVDVDDEDVCAFLDEAPGDALAKSRSGARDERRLLRQLTVTVAQLPCQARVQAAE